VGTQRTHPAVEELVVDLYVDGVTVAEISRRCKVAAGTVYTILARRRRAPDRVWANWTHWSWYGQPTTGGGRPASPAIRQLPGEGQAEACRAP
jgi:hypothetical protein